MNVGCSDIMGNTENVPCDHEFNRRKFSALIEGSFYSSWEEYYKTRELLFGNSKQPLIQYPKEFLNTIRI